MRKVKKRKIKKDAWVHYIFVNNETGDEWTTTFWWHPRLGDVDLYINGKLKGKKKC